MFRRVLTTGVLAGVLVAWPFAAIAGGPAASRGAGTVAGGATDPQGCAAAVPHQAQRDAALARSRTAAPSAEPAGAPWIPNDLGGLTDFNNTGGLAVTAQMKAAVVSTSGNYIWVTRTTNAGADWTGWAEIPDGNWKTFEASVSNSGRYVDVLSAAWKGQTGDALHYFRSTNGGRTWHAPVNLGRAASHVRVVRGPDGTVAAAWWQSGKVKARVSTDGGLNFGPTTTLGTYNVEGCAFETGLLGLSVANGTVVASFWVNFNKFVTRRSTNGGNTWKAPVTLTGLQQGYYNGMASHGNDVVAIYDAKFKLRARISHNKGATWSAPVTITDSAPFATAWVGDVWGLAHDNDSDELVYRESADAAIWSAPNTIDSATSSEYFPYQMGFMYGAPAVAYVSIGDGLDDPEIVNFAIRQ